jgi:uncharacterized protein YbjT (DUF2867 family)
MLLYMQQLLHYTDSCGVVAQPVYVRDVTEAMEAVLKDKGTIGKTYALAGPRTYTCACSC